MRKPADLAQGTRGLLILKTIAAAVMRGSVIAKRIRHLFGTVLQVRQRTFDSVLHYERFE